MSSFEQRARQVPTKRLTGPTAAAPEEVHYISTPQAARPMFDQFNDYSGLSPDTDGKPLSCKWWATKSGERDGPPSVQPQPLHSFETSRSHSFDPKISPTSPREEVRFRAATAQQVGVENRKCRNCDWQSASRQIIEDAEELRVYLIEKRETLRVDTNEIEKYTHFMTQSLAVIMDTLKPRLSNLYAHNEKCVWIPKCSWQCGKAYMQMAGVLMYLLDIQMLSSQCIGRLHTSIKAKRDKLGRQARKLEELHEQYDALRGELELTKDMIRKSKSSPESRLGLCLEQIDDLTGECIPDQSELWRECEPVDRFDLDLDLKEATKIDEPAPKSTGRPRACPPILYLFIGTLIGMALGSLTQARAVEKIIDYLLWLAEPPQYKYLCKKY